MRYLLICLFLSGCASLTVDVIKTDTGIKVNSNKNCLVKYKDKDVEVEVDSRGQPLVAIGDLPDLDMK